MKKSIVAAAVVAAAGMYAGVTDVFAEETATVVSPADETAASEYTEEPFVEDGQAGKDAAKPLTDTFKGQKKEAGTQPGAAEGEVPAENGRSSKTNSDKAGAEGTAATPAFTAPEVPAGPQTTDDADSDEIVLLETEDQKTKRDETEKPEQETPGQGWTDTADGRVYYGEDGSLYKGVQSIEGHLYYFNKDGVLQYGQQLIGNVNGADQWIYGDNTTGILFQGWKDLSAEENPAGPKRVYYNPLTGIMHYGELAQDSQEYYLSYLDGHMLTNRLLQLGDGRTVWYGADGVMVKNQQAKINNEWYYFNKYGGMVSSCFMDLTVDKDHADQNKTVYYDYKGRMSKGLKNIFNDWYCFDLSNGAMKTGLTLLDDRYGVSEPKTVFFNDGTDSAKRTGAMLTGLHHVNNGTYFFSGDGAMLTNSMKSGITINGKTGTVYFGNDGKMVRGQVQTDAHEWRYFSREDGFMVTGFKTLSKTLDKTDRDKTVYYGSDGVMKYGQVFIDKLWYCFDRFSGAMITDFFKLTDWYEPSGEKWVYYNKEDNANGPKGAMVKGFQQINGKDYYFDRISGERAAGQQWINQAWYCFDIDTGVMKTGRVTLDDRYESEGPKDVYYQTNGSIADGKGRMVYGEISLGNGRYLFAKRVSGALQSTYVRKEGNQLKAYNENGDWSGEIQGHYNGHWMYFGKDKNPVKNQLINLSTRQTDDGPKTVYYDENGYMVYGMRKFNDGWKFFRPGSGAMARNELVTLSKEQNLFSHRDQDSIFDNNGNLVLKPKYTLDGREYDIDVNTGAAECALPSWCYISNGQVIFDAPGYPTQVASVDSKLGQLLLAAAQCWDASFNSGGRNNNESLDCIGFVMRCYNLAFGLNLQASSVHDFVTARNYSYAIPESALEPGDLVVFRGTWTPVISHYTHSSIYLGNGMIMYMTYSGATMGSMYGIGYYGGGPAPREARRIPL